MKFYDVEDVEFLSSKQIQKIYKNHYSNVLYKLYKYTGINNNFVKAAGMNVWDHKGNKYVDFLGGFGALNLGHNDERIIDTINALSEKPNMLQLSINPYAAILANNISFLTKEEFTYSYFTNSGTETVEEAIKLAQLYNKDGAIIYFSNAYHGKTLGSISALGNKLKNKYKPYSFSFIEAPFGDIEKVKEIILNNDISGIIIEPIQGEGGINLASFDFFKDLRKICDKEDIILIFDEIQTGLGRCGSMFYYEEIGVVPDILCLSKSLSGGIIPIGCMAVEEALWGFTYGKLGNGTSLTCTFGGNTLACGAAIKTLSIISQDDLCSNSKNMGAYAVEKLKLLKENHKIIKDVRGDGLLIGIEFNNYDGLIPTKVMELMVSTIISRLLNEYKIITGFTVNNPSVLRFEPPLIVCSQEIDYFVDSFQDILKDEDSIVALALSSIKNIKGNIM